MDQTTASGTRVLNFGLATFLLALSAMILLYKWII